MISTVHSHNYRAWRDRFDSLARWLTVVLLLLLFLHAHGWAQQTALSNPSQNQYDASGNLKINCQTGCAGGGGGGTSAADEATFTQGTTSLTPIGGFFNTSITNLTSGQLGAVQMTNDRKMYVQAFQGTSPWVESASQSGTWTVQPGNTQNTTPWLVAGKDAVGAATSVNPLFIGCTFVTSPSTLTTGQAGALQCDSTQHLLVSQNGTWNVTVNTALPTGANTIGKVNILGNAGAIVDAAQGATAPANNISVAGTFNNQTGTTGALTAGQASTPQLDNHGLMLVDLQSEAGTAITSTPTAYGTAATGNVIGVNAFITNSPTPGTGAGSTAAVTTSTNNATLTTAVVDKATAGNLYGVAFQNGSTTTACYVELINTASSPALGTNAVFSITMTEQQATSAGWGGVQWFNPPVRFSTGISVGIATAYNGSTACGTAGNVTLFYN